MSSLKRQPGFSETGEYWQVTPACGVQDLPERDFFLSFPRSGAGCIKVG
ncbi:hypothetical protein ISS30_10575 [bacterium]|nr:hypothetical protein [bacterium]